MPGAKKIANDSDAQSKPQMMHGRMVGMLALLTGTMEKMAALPLKMTIQDGAKEMASGKDPECPGKHTLSRCSA